MDCTDIISREVAPNGITPGKSDGYAFGKLSSSNAIGFVGGCPRRQVGKKEGSYGTYKEEEGAMEVNRAVRTVAISLRSGLALHRTSTSKRMPTQTSNICVRRIARKSKLRGRVFNSEATRCEAQRHRETFIEATKYGPDPAKSDYSNACHSL